MNKKRKILNFCMVFVVSAAFAQNRDTLLLLKLTSNPVKSTLFSLGSNKTIKTNPVLSSSFYASNLGFFCKQEIKFDKITTIPVRFRLGSIEEVNRLEGKGRR